MDLRLRLYNFMYIQERKPTCRGRGKRCSRAGWPSPPDKCWHPAGRAGALRGTDGSPLPSASPPAPSPHQRPLARGGVAGGWAGLPNRPPCIGGEAPLAPGRAWVRPHGYRPRAWPLRWDDTDSVRCVPKQQSTVHTSSTSPLWNHSTRGALPGYHVLVELPPPRTPTHYHPTTPPSQAP